MVSNLIKQIPENIKPSQVLGFMENNRFNLLSELKNVSNLPNNKIFYCLEISITYYKRHIRKPELINAKTKEHILLLILLFKKGNRVFGGNSNFKSWLDKENLFFDNAKPISSLQFISGIKYISDRLTSVENGDNV